MIQMIRKKIPQEEFDYQTLLVALGDYARPRDKISDLIARVSSSVSKRDSMFSEMAPVRHLIPPRSWQI